MFSAQWHLINSTWTYDQTYFNDQSYPPYTGSDITITQIKSTQTGCGIKVAVVDTGMEIAHEDLAANVVTGASYNFVTGGVDPTSADPTGDHGTSVAGLVGAVAGNGVGGRGVAGQASLVGYNFLMTPSTPAYEVPSLGAATYAGDVDIFNQSYGATLLPLDPTIEAQLKAGVSASLRGPGAGAIYVKAAGNSFLADSALNCTLANKAGVSCMDASMDGENTTPYEIVVGALNSGYGATAPTKSSYSTAGSALWISAPGGEFGIDRTVATCSGCPIPGDLPAMITTDQSGCSAGFAVNFFNGETTVNKFNYANGNSVQPTYNPNCNYTSSFNGTSSATPVTSGAIAVLLSANPALTWRDVKYILAATATQVDTGQTTSITCGSVTFPSVSAWTSWKVGSQNFNFHPWYGFGKVNLDAAVTMATTGWTVNGFGTGTAANTMSDTGWLPGTSSVYPAGTGPNANLVAIPDCNSTGVLTPSQKPSSVTFIEAVQVNVCFVNSANPGEIQFELNLINPTGGPPLAISVILPGQNGFNLTSVGTAPGCQVFLTNAFYGMPATGGFTLTAKDTVLTGSSTNNLYGWQLRVYGH